MMIITIIFFLQRDIKAGTDKFVQKQLPPILKCFAKAVSLNNRHCYIIEKVKQMHQWTKLHQISDHWYVLWCMEVYRSTV